MHSRLPCPPSASRARRATPPERALFARLIELIDPHERLARGVAGQHPYQRLRRSLEAVDDRLAIAQSALAQPPAELAHDVGQAVLVGASAEAAQGEVVRRGLNRLPGPGVGPTDSYSEIAPQSEARPQGLSVASAASR